MLNAENFDSRPLRARIKEMLKLHPEGLSTKELSILLGDPQYTISSVISKLHSYGAGVDKCGANFGPGCKWRLKTEKTNAGP
jgi:hypothetical protein